MGLTHDWGVYPIGLKRTEPVVTRPDMVLLSEPILARPSYMLTATLYESAPAAIMAIFHRLSQASELVYHPAIRGYQVLTRRLAPEDYDAFMAWYQAENERIAAADGFPFARPPMRAAVSARVPTRIPAHASARARLSSDPPPPKIEA